MTALHEHGTPEIALRVEALESLLTEKGLLDPAAVDSVIRFYEQDVGPLNGARAVARAWIDAAFRERLVANAPAAFAELGIRCSDHVIVVANTPAVHNVVVCTLCSCYPWSVLGLPPTWYKSPAYRARIVREPRAVLAEMGLPLGEQVEVRVWDSSAEIRYLEALAEHELVALVSRDCMIGVARPGAAAR